MIYSLIGPTVFIIITIVHIFLHRLLAKKGIRTFKSVYIYGLGLILLISLSAPATGTVLYSVLSILNIIFFTSPYMGNISPSYKIMLTIKESHGLSKQAILKQFSDQELIGKRLDNLVLDGFLQKKEKLFKILPKGEKIISFIDFYRSCLKWRSSG